MRSTHSKKKSKRLSTKTAKGRLFGCEGKLSHHPFLEDWGWHYQSFLRTAVRKMIDGATEDAIEKSFQTRFNIQWAWADSIATEAVQKVRQRHTARDNQIKALNSAIKSATDYAKKRIKVLEKKISKAVTSIDAATIEKQLQGLKSKLLRVERNREKLTQLESEKRLKVVFGGKKLFNAQHHLEVNGYQSHSQWYEDWQKSRSGNFYSVGKGRLKGSNPVIRIQHTAENWFSATIVVPYFLQSDYGSNVSIDFEVNPKHAGALSWALNNDKPVTVRCFRREDKNDGWYIGLTSYDVLVPWVSDRKNATIGIDLNAKSVDIACIKPDGNLKWHKTYRFDFERRSSGQSQARLWDICADIVKLASSELCPLGIENLDFASKKTSMREQPKGYNRILSQFCYDKFRNSLQSRCDKHGIQLIQVAPTYSSTIGMIKFMGRYGLSSGTAAALVLARRALRLSERLPRCVLKPEDFNTHPWSFWNKISRTMREHSIPRHQLFGWRKFPEVFSALTETSNGNRRRKMVKSASSKVLKQAGLRSIGRVTDAPEPVQLSLFDMF